MASTSRTHPGAVIVSNPFNKDDYVILRADCNGMVSPTVDPNGTARILSKGTRVRILEGPKFNLNRRTSLASPNEPFRAEEILYRLGIELDEWHAATRVGAIVPSLLVPQANLLQSPGGQPLNAFWPKESIAYLASDITYQLNFEKVTIKAGSAVGILSLPKTKSGGTPGIIQPKNSYYAIARTHVTRTQRRWKSERMVDHSYVEAEIV